MVYWIYFMKQGTISTPSNKQVLIFEQICLLMLKSLQKTGVILFHKFKETKKKKERKKKFAKGVHGKGNPITVNTDLVVNKTHHIVVLYLGIIVRFLCSYPSKSTWITFKSTKAVYGNHDLTLQYSQLFNWICSLKTLLREDST